MPPSRRLLRRAIRAGTFGLVLGTSVAGAEVVDIAWTAEGGFERTLVVPAGKFAEACGKLAQGARVTWQYASDVPMGFNIHYHVGKDVVYPVRQEGAATASGTFVAPVDQDYCWMWTNKSAGDARTTVTLKR